MNHLLHLLIVTKIVKGKRQLRMNFCKLRFTLLFAVVFTVCCAFRLSKETLNKEVDGRYRLIKHLGSGSYGKVYSAVDSKTQSKVAIKLEKVTSTIENENVRRKDLALDVEYRRYKSLEGAGNLIDTVEVTHLTESYFYM